MVEYIYQFETMIRQLLKCNTINNIIATKRCLSNDSTARMVLSTTKCLNHQLVASSTPSLLLNLPSQQQQQQRPSTTPRLSFSTAVATDDEPLLGVGKYKTSTGLVCDETRKNEIILRNQFMLIECRIFFTFSFIIKIYRLD